jgi:hypothetical protein
MRRKTAAQLILEDLGDEEETEDMYLVSYDFIEDKSNPRFWSNLREVISMTGARWSSTASTTGTGGAPGL